MIRSAGGVYFLIQKGALAARGEKRRAELFFLPTEEDPFRKRKRALLSKEGGGRHLGVRQQKNRLRWPLATFS